MKKTDYDYAIEFRDYVLSVFDRDVEHEDWGEFCVYIDGKYVSIGYNGKKYIVYESGNVNIGHFKSGNYKDLVFPDFKKALKEIKKVLEPMREELNKLKKEQANNQIKALKDKIKELKNNL